MLVLALAVAGVGFAFLIAALVTGSVIWAWVCIIVSVIGVVLLFADIFSTRTSGPTAEETVRQELSVQGKSDSDGKAQLTLESPESEASTEL